MVISCVTVTVVTPANITATNITATPSDPCVFGSCAVDVSVTWTNSGEATGAIIPNITIDGFAAEPTPSLVDVVGLAILTITFTVTGLAAGSHSICPSPN